MENCIDCSLRPLPTFKIKTAEFIPTFKIKTARVYSFIHINKYVRKYLLCIVDAYVPSTVDNHKQIKNYYYHGTYISMEDADNK